MLELTQSAIDALNELSKGTDNGGLRIFRHRSVDELKLSAVVVDRPADGDEVVEQGGARVFLDDAVIGVLAGKRLDARVSDGRLRLSVLEQT